MKKLYTSLAGIALIAAMFLSGSILQAQDIQIDDGASVLLNPGTHANIITSTTGSNNSTALLQTSGAVTLSGTYTNYFGRLELQDQSSVSLNSSVFGSYFFVGNTSYTGLTSISVDKTGGVTFSGSSSDSKADMLTLDKYGMLDMKKDLTLTKGGILMNSYDNANAPYMKFYIASTTPKITVSESGKTIKTDETSNRIDASKNLYFDMTNAPQTSLGTNHFTIATFTDTDPGLVITTPTNISGNNDQMWEGFSVDVDGSHNLRLNATFAPLFDINSGGTTFTGTMDGLSIRNSLAWQKLLKNKALAAGYSITDDLMIDLQGYQLSGDQTFTIGDGKILGLEHTSGGVLAEAIAFGGTTSVLRFIGSIGSGILGTNMTGSTAGTVVMGDGTNSTSLTLDSDLRTRFNNKVATVVVKANSSLTVTP